MSKKPGSRNAITLNDVERQSQNFITCPVNVESEEYLFAPSFRPIWDDVTNEAELSHRLFTQAPGAFILLLPRRNFGWVQVSGSYDYANRALYVRAMLVDEHFFTTVLARSPGQPFQCESMGLFVSPQPRMMTFLDDLKYLNDVQACEQITVVLTTSEIEASLHRPGVTVIVCEDPRYDFFTLRNSAYRARYLRTPSKIASSAQIHPRASISDFNVVIGENTIVGANATVLPDVVVGSNCVIQANAVIGSEGFEYKRTSHGLVPVFHDAGVILEDEVEIGSNSCIDKGIWGIDTHVGFQTKIDNLVHVAHSVRIGKRCLVIASAMLGGSVTLGDDVWVGPHANIAPQLKIGDKAFITLGSVVTKNVSDGEWVTGNFAVPHQKFLRNLKRSLSD